MAGGLHERAKIRTYWSREEDVADKGMTQRRGLHGEIILTDICDHTARFQPGHHPLDIDGQQSECPGDACPGYPGITAYRECGQDLDGPLADPSLQEQVDGLLQLRPECNV